MVLVLLLVSGIRYIHRQMKIKWAIEQAIPEIEHYLNDLDMINAFELCQKARKYISDDPVFIDLDSIITTSFTIITDPEGADVFYKAYPEVEGEWILLGTTPIVNVEMPIYTLFRWKLEKPGYEVVYAVAPTGMDTLFRTLHKSGTIPDGMVYVEGINDQTAGNFLSKDKNGFFIDRYEVTNQQFKVFVDDGGYQNQEYWQNEFILNNDTLTFEEAIYHFKDVTGRPGPATWEAGDYPEGDASRKAQPKIENRDKNRYFLHLGTNSMRNCLDRLLHIRRIWKRPESRIRYRSILFNFLRRKS